MVKETTLYSAFARLEKGGLVESFPQVAENGKRRTYYRITPAGIDHYQARCREWKLTKDVVGRFMEGCGA
jgi:PadR family transcriptional regulator PadR